MNTSEFIKFLKNKIQNVFVSGPAGTGKTVLLREAVLELRKAGLVIVICAPTGIGAGLAGGTTLHSFLGLRPDDLKTTKKRSQRIIAFQRKILRLGLKIDMLVIDEVSMMSCELFDFAMEALKKVASINFRILVFGDFLQLPPVNNSAFAFQSKSWQDINFEYFLLKRSFRTNDDAFSEALSKVRKGELTDDVIQYFSSLNALSEKDVASTTFLFPRKLEVERYNEQRLAELPGAVRTYESLDVFNTNNFAEQLSCGNIFRFAKVLHLKIGAEVMFLINDPQHRFFNGSIGNILDLGESFVTIKSIQNITFTLRREREDVFCPCENERVLATRTQFPISLGKYYI